MKKVKEYHKIRTIRISNKIFSQLKEIKKRGESWNLFLIRLLNKK